MWGVVYFDLVLEGLNPSWQERHVNSQAGREVRPET